MSLVLVTLSSYIKNHNKLPQPLEELSQTITELVQGLPQFLLQGLSELERTHISEANATQVRGISYDLVAALRTNVSAIEGQALVAQDYPAPIFAIDHYTEGIVRTQKFRSRQLFSEEDQPLVPSLVDDALGVVQYCKTRPSRYVAQRLREIAVQSPGEEEFFLKTFQALIPRSNQNATLQRFSEMLLQDLDNQDGDLGEHSYAYSLLRMLERTLICLKGDILLTSPSHAFTNVCRLATISGSLRIKAFSNLY